SSIHIEEYEIDARETKLGAEEITGDLPNVGEDAVANLDERGIFRIGAEVEAGDILVGKVNEGLVLGLEGFLLQCVE
ncbi:hypothetical protein, partial [Bifidobacterium longum]|uniref:hypothetical protein n=1 Tax=Bifidobacterium longum TaxID=216816 RepID=UPI003EBC0254